MAVSSGTSLEATGIASKHSFMQLDVKLCQHIIEIFDYLPCLTKYMLTCLTRVKPQEQRVLTIVLITVDSNKTNEAIDQVCENISCLSQDKILSLGVSGLSQKC